MNDIGEFPCLFCHIDLSKWESAVRDGRGEERGWDIYLSVPVLRDHLWLDYNPGSGHNFSPSALSISVFLFFWLQEYPICCDISCDPQHHAHIFTNNRFIELLQ